MKTKSLSTLWLVVGGAGLCAALVIGGILFPDVVTPTELSTSVPFLGGEQPVAVGTHKFRPFLELMKLVAAATMALVVTYLNRRLCADRPLSKSLEHAQILLCVAGAMMMIIIGNSVARALGIAGAASIIRFRTPVEDPKDTVILFLLLSLGMSCGLGAFAVAGLGTFFLCMFLLILHRVGEAVPRSMMLDIVAKEPGRFPARHVQKVLGAELMDFEAREVTQDRVKYFAVVPPGVPLEEISAKLFATEEGLKSVIWETPKKGKRTEDPV